MAGGDLDGDENFWTIWPKLVALLKATKEPCVQTTSPCLVFAIESFPPLQDATESVPVKELEREVMAVLPQPCTAFDTVDRDARRS